MMQCKAKSENLAQILGYQNWAVTVDIAHVQEVRSAVLHHRRQAKGQEGPTTHRERGRLPPLAAHTSTMISSPPVISEPPLHV